MDIFGVLSFVGGLAMFLYGMSAMGDGLTKLSGGKLEYLLEKLTSKRIMAVLLGAGVTAVIQSSSATTVMVVGFVNSGIMKLNQAVGIIMGANIGTTITSWILSLTGIQGDNVFIKMLNPSSFSPILAIIGVFMLMLAKSDKKKNVGTLLTGFSILMFGMHTMSSAVSPLADVPEFTGLLVKFSMPVLGVLAGTILTAVIQSSSASVGILQALCATGSVSYAVAIPIIMGQNIGTCITALLSSIGTCRNARRTAMVHLYFNIIGTVLFLVLFYGINAFVHFPFLETSANAAGIAIVHSGFNIFATLILFPFADGLVKLAKLTIPDGPEEKADEAVQMLETRFLDSPAFALQQCKVAAAKMAEQNDTGLAVGFGARHVRLRLRVLIRPEKLFDVQLLVFLIVACQVALLLFVYRCRGGEPAFQKVPFGVFQQPLRRVGDIDPPLAPLLLYLVNDDEVPLIPVDDARQRRDLAQLQPRELHRGRPQPDTFGCIADAQQRYTLTGDVATFPQRLQGVVAAEELRDDFQRRRTAVHRIELGVVGESCHIRPYPLAIEVFTERYFGDCLHRNTSKISLCLFKYADNGFVGITKLVNGPFPGTHRKPIFRSECNRVFFHTLYRHGSRQGNLLPE